MKKYLHIIVFLPFILFSQKKDLYITYDDISTLRVYKSENGFLISETYNIDFNQKDKLHYSLSVNETGDVSKNVVVVGSLRGSLALTYTNENNNNLPIVVTSKDMSNSISTLEIIYSYDSDIFALTQKFKNVYLVDMTAKNQNYYLAKKVFVTKKPGI